jgi:hypothetical protein
MKIAHIHDVPLDEEVVWMFSKATFQSIIGKRNVKVAFVANTAEEEQILLALIPKIDTLYVNPNCTKTPELKNLILRLNPEILL